MTLIFLSLVFTIRKLSWAFWLITLVYIAFLQTGSHSHSCWQSLQDQQHLVGFSQGHHKNYQNCWDEPLTVHLVETLITTSHLLTMTVLPWLLFLTLHLPFTLHYLTLVLFVLSCRKRFAIMPTVIVRRLILRQFSHPLKSATYLVWRILSLVRFVQVWQTSNIFKHLQNSEPCCTLCSNDCFSILDQCFYHLPTWDKRSHSYSVGKNHT